MNNKYEAILKSAKDLLESMDTDVFLDKFLELQEHATGPNIDEFTSSISTSGSFLSDHDSYTSPNNYKNILSHFSVDKVNTILDSTNSKKGYFLEVRSIGTALKIKKKATQVSYEYGFSTDQLLSQAA